MSASGQARWHWWGERLTAAALAPLSVWFIFSLSSQNLANRSLFEQWVAQTDTLIWLSLFLLASVYHARLGLESIVNDYVSDSSWNRWAHRLCRFVLFASLLAALLGLLHFVL